MGVEIERKFLVDHSKWALADKPFGTPFRQGYLLNEDQHTIRIRITDKEGFITLKGPTNGITRSEFEYTIPIADGAELLDGFATSEIKKVRYRIPFDGKLWEIDVFEGDNDGLIIAEIELKSENETFEKPDWVLGEVSDDPRYYNSNLSVHPFKGW